MQETRIKGINKMKIYMGPFSSFYSLYTTLETMKRKGWITEEKADYIYELVNDNPVLDKISDFIYGTLNKLFYRQQKIKVRIDNYDTWNMDSTLAHIIYPMLVQLEATQHGAPNVDNEDVPEELHRAPTENDWDTDDNHFKRWDYVLGEMIWTFNEIRLGKSASDMIEYPEGYFDDWIKEAFVKTEDGLYEMVKRPIDEQVIRPEAEMKAYDERRMNGLRLFGKYYHSLWD